MRAPARKPRWLNPAPCTAAKGMYLVGARKQESDVLPIADIGSAVGHVGFGPPKADMTTV